MKSLEEIKKENAEADVKSDKTKIILRDGITVTRGVSNSAIIIETEHGKAKLTAQILDTIVRTNNKLVKGRKYKDLFTAEDRIISKALIRALWGD